MAKNKLADSGRPVAKHMLFPTVCYELKIDPETTSRMAARLRDWREKDENYDPEGVIWVSNDNCHVHKDFKPLNEYLLGVMRSIMEDLAIDANADTIYCTGMWGNISKRWYQHQVHTHPNSWYSGILYLETPEGSGSTIFNDPRAQRFVIQPDHYGMKAENAYQFQSKAEAGKIMLWPSWMEHAVAPGLQSGDEERISLAFNFNYHTKINRITQRWKF